MPKAEKMQTELTKEAALTVVPVISQAIAVETLATGEVLITYPTTLKPWLIKWMRRLGHTPKPVNRKLQLDILGSSVWRLLDDQRSVKQIIGQFAQIHQLHPKEAEVSVTQFLRSLGQRGIIGMKLK